MNKRKGNKKVDDGPEHHAHYCLLELSFHWLCSHASFLLYTHLHQFIGGLPGVNCSLMYKKKSGRGGGESQEDSTVWLGVRGQEIKWAVNTVGGKEAADAYTSKIGGWPVRVRRKPLLAWRLLACYDTIYPSMHPWEEAF